VQTLRLSFPPPEELSSVAQPFPRADVFDREELLRLSESLESMPESFYRSLSTTSQRSSSQGDEEDSELGWDDDEDFEPDWDEESRCGACEFMRRACEPGWREDLLCEVRLFLRRARELGVTTLPLLFELVRVLRILRAFRLAGRRPSFFDRSRSGNQ
jgi:hypothetical protein